MTNPTMLNSHLRPVESGGSAGPGLPGGGGPDLVLAACLGSALFFLLFTVRFRALSSGAAYHREWPPDNRLSLATSDTPAGPITNSLLSGGFTP